MKQTTHLVHKLKEIVSDRIHQAKCEAFEHPFKEEKWKAIDPAEIAESIVTEIVEMLELWLYLPCCHVSDDPEHFTKREYICPAQKAEALERFCRDLGINPVTRSSLDCFWCHNYPHYRKGEGLHLFPEGEDEDSSNQ